MIIQNKKYEKKEQFEIEQNCCLEKKIFMILMQSKKKTQQMKTPF